VEQAQVSQEQAQDRREALAGVRAAKDAAASTPAAAVQTVAAAPATVKVRNKSVTSSSGSTAGQVLGVSTQRDHTEEYYLDLKNQIGELRSAAEISNTDLHASVEKMQAQNAGAQLYQNIAYVILVGILALLAFAAETRYVKLTDKFITFKKKFSRKGRGKSSK
jgi:lipopolysaccharide export LptBFGC system permease protein LptF